MKPHRTPRSVIPLVLILAGMLAACGDKPAPAASTPKAVYVMTTQRSTASELRILTATVRARLESELAFRASGKVVQRLVEIGDTVKAGQALARLDAADYQLAVNAAAAQVQAAAVDAEQAAADAARFGRLAAEGSVGAADHERQKARAEAAAARLDQAQRQLALARNRNDYTTLQAPFAGVVTALHLETGQVVAEGQPVVSLAGLDAHEFVVDLPENLVGSRRGLKATARPGPGTGQAIPLTLRELSPVAGAQGRTFRARFAASGEGRERADRLPLGSTATVSLEAEGFPGVLLPASAIVKGQGSEGVWTVDTKTNSLKFQPVQLAASEVDFVRVTGLPEGLRVVTVGAQKLEASMKVRPLERRDDAQSLNLARTGS